MPTRFLMPAAAAAAASVELRHSPAACAQWLYSRSLLHHRLRPPRPPSGGVCGTPETAIATAVSASEARTQAQDSPGSAMGRKGAAGTSWIAMTSCASPEGPAGRTRWRVAPSLHAFMCKRFSSCPTVPRVSARPFCPQPYNTRSRRYLVNRYVAVQAVEVGLLAGPLAAHGAEELR